MLGDDTLAPPFLSSESLSVEEEELSDFDRLKKKKKKSKTDIGQRLWLYSQWNALILCSQGVCFKNRMGARGS